RRDGGWMIEGPSAQRADSATVRAMLSTIRNLRATDFANDQPAPADLETYGLATPRREFVLRARADREHRPLVGAETDQGLDLKTGDRPTTFIVGKWVAGDLTKGVADLRDRTLLTFDPTTVGTITVARPAENETVTLTRGDAGWTVSGVTEAVDSEA